MTLMYTNVARYGNSILFRGYDNGEQITKKFKFKPSLFISGKDGSDTKWSTMEGHKVDEVVFDSMKDAKNFIERYDNVSGFSVYGNTNYISQFIQQVFSGDIEYVPEHIRTLYFDIEVDITEGYGNTTTATKPITSITMKYSDENDMHVLTLEKHGEYDPSKCEVDMKGINIIHHHCKDEYELLRKFVSLWSYKYPDVVSGWNCKFFDVAYIVQRIKNVISEDVAKKLSPWGNISRREVEIFGRKEPTYEIMGVTVLDYMDVFKKFGFKYLPQESFKLDHIANAVLGERKLDYDEYGDLNGLLARNYQKYVDYNIKDTLLIERMEDKTGLLSLTFGMAYRGGVNYIETLGTTGIWDTILFRYLSDQNMVVPMPKFSNSDFDLVGGYVKEPVPGMYEHVCSFDLNSLYPHLMMQYNMSPETHRPRERMGCNPDLVLEGMFNNEGGKYSVAANGAAFDQTKKGMIPTIIDSYYSERAAVKKKMIVLENAVENGEYEGKAKVEAEKQIAQYHNIQMSIKILMNSLYGAWGNKYFRYYVAEIAEAITMSGQLSLKWAERTTNEYFQKLFKNKKNYVIYADTDSIYVHMNDLVTKVLGDDADDRDKLEKFLDNVCAKKLDPLLASCYSDLARIMGAYDQKMFMAREVIADKAVWTGKKKYFLSVLNNEGIHYPTPKIKVTGIESVRSSTPKVCREKLKDVFGIIINGSESELHDFVGEFEQEFKTLRPEDIARPTGVNGVEDRYDPHTLYTKGTPFHVRGALVYNRALEEKGIENKYEKIVSGDKIKSLYMSLPNPIRENSFSFATVVPKELNLEQYVDYKTQFEKTFVKPIDNIVKTFGWSVKKKDTLDAFFS